MKKYKLKDITKIYNGSTPSTTDTNNYDGDIIWITPKDLSTNKCKYISKGSRNITKQGYESCSTTLLPKGTILLSSRAPIGLLAITSKELCTNQGFKNIVPNSKLLNSDYLYYLLMTRIREIEALGNGTTFKEISKASLENYQISIDNIQNQQKIANVLSSLDNKIELNNKINKELEQMAKDLYNYWFIQFDFPDENKRPYKSSGGKMVYNDVLKREIPVGWEVLSLEKRLNMKRGTEFGSNKYVEDKSTDSNFVKFYRVGDMDDSGSTYIPVKLPDIELLNTSDLAVSFDGSVGRIAIGLSGAYSSGIRKITDKKNIITTGTLFFIFNDKEIQDTIHKYATGSNILHASASIPYLFIAYDEKTFLNFQTKITPIFNLLLKNKLENKKLINLRDFLLPMLMNGQVSII